MKERRKHVRADADWCIRYRLIAKSKKNYLSSTLQGTIINVSTGGLCVLTSDPLEVGSELEIEMLVARDGRHSLARRSVATGEVLEVTPAPDGKYKVRVKFHGLGAQDEALIHGEIKRKLNVEGKRRAA